MAMTHISRYGYDPRKHAASSSFQLIDYRLKDSKDTKLYQKVPLPLANFLLSTSPPANR